MQFFPVRKIAVAGVAEGRHLTGSAGADQEIVFSVAVQIAPAHPRAQSTEAARERSLLREIVERGFMVLMRKQITQIAKERPWRRRSDFRSGIAVFRFLD